MASCAQSRSRAQVGQRKKEIVNIIIGEALPRPPAEPHTERATKLCNHIGWSFLLYVAMDITDFIVSQRQKALLVGDYGSYRKQLSRRLLVVRRKLNYTSMKGRKYAAKTPVSADDIAKNHEFVDFRPMTTHLLKSSADLYTYYFFLPNEHGPMQCI